MSFGRPTAVVALGLLAAAGAQAYYHFVHFADGRRHVERFDVASLPDSRVDFYLSLAERPQIAANDSLTGLISQVRHALAVWDSVPVSSLRVGFGGVIGGELPGSAPAGEILFAELPPGVLGLGRPVRTAEPSEGTAAILRSQIVLSNDLIGGARRRYSHSELFFNTLVHEIGHALGLQHTLASSAMSTDVTRATTRARPLDADDVAGLATLYPTPAFTRLAGSLEGRVTLEDGSPIALASVGAVSASGRVVTALTDPDGSYRIEGLETSSDYRLWVQPLPAAAQDGIGPGGVILPDSPDGSFAAAPAFRGQAAGGGLDVTRSPAYRPSPEGAPGPNFRVVRREENLFGGITTYSFPQRRLPSLFASQTLPAIHPAFLPLDDPEPFILAVGTGLTDRLAASEVGARDTPVAVSSYTLDPRFVRLDFQLSSFSAPGPLHLQFRSADDLYVLPSAVQLTAERSPLIYWLIPDFLSLDGSWVLWGDRLQPGAQVFFDGVPAEILDFDSQLQEIRLRPPPGPPGHRAVVVVYNPDGQTSTIEIPDGNVVFEYPEGPEPDFAVASTPVEPGTDAVIEIRGRNLALRSGLASLGVGTADVAVRRVQVLRPDRLRAVVSVAANAQPGEYPVTLTNGLTALTRPNALTVGSAGITTNAQPRLRFGALVNAGSGRPEVSPGSLATLTGERLAARDGAPPLVTIGGLAARVLAASPERLELLLPENLPVGVAELTVSNGEAESEPMLVEISSVAPGLFGLAFDGFRESDPLDEAVQMVELVATGLGPRSSRPRVQVVARGSRLRPVEVRPDDAPGLWRVRFAAPLEWLTLDRPVPVAISVNGRLSNPTPLNNARSLVSALD